MLGLATRTPVDVLRLRFCPQCDYSFETLPEEGVCPECGRAYDTSFVILRGAPMDARALMSGNFSARSIAAAMIPMSGFLFVVLFDLRYLGSFLAVYVMVIGGIGLMSWLSSPRPGEILVWLSADGAGQQNEFDPTSMTAMLKRLAPFALLPLWFAMAPPASFKRAVFWVMLGAWTVVIGSISVVVGRSQRAAVAAKATGIRPALIKWKFLEPKLSSIKPGRFRLRVKQDSAIATYPIDIAFDATQEEVLHLETQIKVWRIAADKG